jgi:hypothetical protein
MRMPEILTGESLTRLLQGTAVGIAATLLIGFKFLDWSMASGAEKLAQERSKAAVVTALAPLCAARFRQANDAAANIVQLQKESTWNRGSFIRSGGWAKFEGQTGSEFELADACATLLGSAKS